MGLTREKEQDHTHFRWAEQEALSLNKGVVIVHQGEPVMVLAELFRYLDKESFLVWVCYEVESKTTEMKCLVVLRANECVVVDTWATCKGECR